MDWKDLTDDEKVLKKRRLFESVAKKLKCRTLTINDLVNDAIIWYINSGRPEKVSRKIIRYKMLNSIIREQRSCHCEYNESESTPKHDTLILPHIPEKERNYLELRYIDDLTYREIAGKENITIRMAKYRVLCAKKVFADKMLSVYTKKQKK